MQAIASFPFSSLATKRALLKYCNGGTAVEGFISLTLGWCFSPFRSFSDPKLLGVSRSKPVGILAKFFGEDGSKKLVLAEFKSFLHDLHNRFVLLEFNHYDYKSSKKIAGKDFARSMCCGADIKRVDSYLDKVNFENCSIAC